MKKKTSLSKSLPKSLRGVVHDLTMLRAARMGLQSPQPMRPVTMAQPLRGARYTRQVRTHPNIFLRTGLDSLARASLYDLGLSTSQRPSNASLAGSLMQSLIAAGRWG